MRTMTWRRTSLAVLACFGILAALAAAGQGTEGYPEYQEFEEGRITLFERFTGEVMLKSGEGERPVTVEIRNWMLGGGLSLPELPIPPEGLMIVQLRGGELTTVIDGEKRERAEGELWTVPAGVRMGLETTDDSAVLQTVVVTGG